MKIPVLESLFNNVAGLEFCNFIKKSLQQRCFPVNIAKHLRTPFFFYVGFLSRTFTNHRAAGEGGGYFINSSLPFPPASQTLRYQPGDYCRDLTSAHSQQPDSNQEPLVSERKSLTTKLRPHKRLFGNGYFSHYQEKIKEVSRMLHAH